MFIDIKIEKIGNRIRSRDRLKIYVNPSKITVNAGN